VSSGWRGHTVRMPVDVVSAVVAGAAADGDGLADVGGESRVEVAQALEADAVAVHHPGYGDLDEQQGQLLEAVGGAG